METPGAASHQSRANGTLDNARQRAVQVFTALPLPRLQGLVRKRSDPAIHHNPSTPPHVAWASWEDGSDEALTIGRSASSPSLQPATGQTTRVRRHSSLRSIRSWRRELHHGANGRRSPPIAPLLSPIVEHDNTSPERSYVDLPAENYSRMSSIERPRPSGNEPDITDLQRPSPVYSTFLSRHLNRSISQTSSRTHLSDTSVPSIPPLDLQPQFPPPALNPQSIGVRGGTRDKDSNDETSSMRAESFLTAQSARSPQSWGNRRSSGDNYEIGTHRRSDPRRRSFSPVRTSPVDDGAREEGRSLESGHRDSIISVAGRNTLSSSSSFINKRWDKDTYLTEGPDGIPDQRPWLLRRPINMACLLFWLGFIAPWCWLIGGWLLESSRARKLKGHMDGGRKQDGLLPLWTVEKMKNQNSQDSRKQGSLLLLGYPFIAPSIDSLPGSTRYSSTSTKVDPQMRLHWRWQVKSPSSNPWVFRCRVAAVTGGVVIIAAFIVAIVVVAKS